MGDRLATTGMGRKWGEAAVGAGMVLSYGAVAATDRYSAEVIEAKLLMDSIWFPIRLSLKVCLYLVPFSRY